MCTSTCALPRSNRSPAWSRSPRRRVPVDDLRRSRGWRVLRVHPTTSRRQDSRTSWSTPLTTFAISRGGPTSWAAAHPLRARLLAPRRRPGVAVRVLRLRPGPGAQDRQEPHPLGRHAPRRRDASTTCSPWEPRSCPRERQIDWTVMADPEGNEFCVFPTAEGGSRAPRGRVMPCASLDLNADVVSLTAALVDIASESLRRAADRRCRRGGAGPVRRTSRSSVIGHTIVARTSPGPRRAGRHRGAPRHRAGERQPPVPPRGRHPARTRHAAT